MPHTSSPPPLQKDPALELTDAWGNLADAQGKLAKAIKEFSGEKPDIPTIKNQITEAITAIADAGKTLSILYPKLKP